MKFSHSILTIPLLIFLVVLMGCQNEQIKTAANIPSNVKSLKLDSRVANYLADLKENKFLICKSDDCIPTKLKDAIYDYLSHWMTDSLHAIFVADNFDNLYSFDQNKINLSSNQKDNVPNRFMRYTILNNNSFAIFYQTGGLVESYWFTVYQIDYKKVLDHWTVQINSSHNQSMNQKELDYSSVPELGILLTDSNMVVVK